MGTHPIFESDFDCLTAIMPIGPPLPPHLRPSTVRSQDADSDSDDNGDDIGPTLPPQLRKRAQPEEKDEEVAPKKQKPIEIDDSDSDGDFGPALPCPAQQGPSLPPEFRKMLAEQNPLYKEDVDLEKYSRPIEEVMADTMDTQDNDEPTVGPMIPVILSPEEQAEAMKKKIEGGDEKKLERESWMTELPALRTAVKFQNQTTFRKHASAAVECGRSEWTKTPNADGTAQMSAVEKRKEEKQKVLNLAEWERNDKQMQKMQSLKRSKESLLTSHQKKMEAEEVDDGAPKGRVAFDRERDMQGSMMDDAKRKAMLKKQAGLGNRFATGQSKFL